MQNVEIIKTAHYAVTSYGNGWAYMVIRDDGAAAWFQDDDAHHLRKELDAANDKWGYDDILSEYETCFIKSKPQD